MKSLQTRGLALAALAIGALTALPGFAQQQNRAAGAAASNAATGAVIQQQQQQLNQQQMYSQGQAAIQGGTQGHAQSQQTLSTLSQRNQAQVDAQAPKYPTAPTTTGNLH